VKTPSYFGVLALFAALASGLIAAGSYRKVATISIGGTGGWDYLTADDQTGRLYVSHTSEVDVADLKSNELVGKISGLTRIHGIAIAYDLNTGFISDGGANQVVAFDLKTLETKNKINAGTNPDGIVYDPYSKQVFAFNGRSKDATVIDAKTGTVVRTIPLPGKPEFPVSDGKGSIYDNIEDKSEIVRIDVKQLDVTAQWSIAPCESPSGLAIDTASRRLFSVCDNKLMAVVDADSGKVVATPAIGEGPDAAAFDPKAKRVFSSNGEGTLTVISELDKDHYAVLENVPTVEGARTMALDPRYSSRLPFECGVWGGSGRIPAKSASAQTRSAGTVQDSGNQQR
jgi:DNA-binding beta-propeller fold protein YncE